MVKTVGKSILGRASEIGVPTIDGVDVNVLSYPAHGADGGLRLVPGIAPAGGVKEWALVLDVYIPQPSSGYVGLVQTGGGDADLFLRDNGDGTAGIGIASVYQGAVPFDAWARIGITVTVEGGDTILRKFVNGAMVGEQNLGATDRWAIDPAEGLRLFTDNDGETAPGVVSSVFFTQELPSPDQTAGIFAALAKPSPDGFFSDQPSSAAIQIDFNGERLAPKFGDAAVILDGDDYRTPLQVGDSAIGFASQFGIEGPGGADIPVLDYAAYTSSEGLRVSLPAGAPDLSSYTAVWDIRVDDARVGFQALLQTDVTNSGDGELFIRGDGGLGINGNYDGAVPSGAWARIAITVTDLGDGSARLEKFLDGVLLDTQTVSADRFTLRSDTGFLLLSDNDGETGAGYLGHFGVSAVPLSPAEVAALGGADADGPFTPSAVTGQIGFDGYKAKVEFGFGEAVLIDAGADDAPKVAHPMRDMLVARGDAPETFDLDDVFGAGYSNFTVTSSHGESVAASVDGHTLTLDYGALGFSDLLITATGADGVELTDHVRVRVAGKGAYTIALLPDTQDYTSNPGIRDTFSNMTQWIIDNAGGKRIGFVGNAGDITQTSTSGQFDIAFEAYDRLRKAGIPYSLTEGNHDIGDGGSANRRLSENYNKVFSVEYMSKDPTFGGVYDQAPDMYDNNYHLWTAPDGTGWVFINLEFGPRQDVIRWANSVLDQHGDRKAVILTHALTNWDGRHDSLGAPLQGEGAGYDYGVGDDPEGAWDGETMWRDMISKHPNVLFTASGHIFGDGAETTTSYNDFGNPVFQFLLNYQNGVSTEATGAGDAARGGNGGNGAIRLVTIDPENDAIYTETYFTELDTYFTGSRGSDEKSRDGLTGAYVGHEETIHNAGVGAREALALADAGDDQVLHAGAGADTAEVALSAARSVKAGADIVSWIWTDADGDVVASGETAKAMLKAGQHDLTLTIKTAAGHSATDTVRVIVADDLTYFAETFDDGDAKGWGPADAGSAPAPVAVMGTDAGFGLPALPGAQGAGVARIRAMAPTEAIKVAPADGGATQTFTLVYDLYLEKGQGGFSSLFQTDLTNGSDGELFLRSNGDGTGGVGISGVYDAGFTYGAWNRLAFVFSVEDGVQKLSKYVDGALIGVQTVDGDLSNGSRWTVGENGFLLFADNDGETGDVFAGAFAYVPKALSAEAVAALGAADADGPFAGSPAEGAVQLSFDGALDATDFGAATVEAVSLGSDTGTSFRVKGSAASRQPGDGLDAPQARLYDFSSAADNLIVWKNGSFEDMTLKVTLGSLDDDTLGVAFRYKDAANHYLLTMDAQHNVHRLVRVAGGVETVLAEEAGTITFYDDNALSLSAIGGKIAVTLDGQPLFGGPVIDANPLGAGTVGLYSSNQHGAFFDDVIVSAPRLDAVAGPDRTLIDWDGDGVETVTLDGRFSVNPGDAAFVWRDASGTLGQGETLDVTLHAGANAYALGLGGDRDAVTVTLATGARLIAADRFEDGDHAGWRIVDTTETGGPADWAVVDGALVERSGASSRELTWAGASNPDVWKRGWSPLGDGVFALHKGSYALWEGDDHLNDYAIQARIEVPADVAFAGGVGFMLNWIDEDNYYKLEIDAHANLTTLVKVVDGYETYIGRVRTTYTPGEAFDLRAERVENKMQAWVNGEKVFAYAHEDRDLGAGSAGVYAWGAAGVRFDDVAIVDMSEHVRLDGVGAHDRLVGTDDAEILATGAGRSETSRGNGGADVFLFGSETANGAREIDRILDYVEGEDAIGLIGGAAGVADWRGAANSVILTLAGGDKDVVVVHGVHDIAQISFVDSLDFA